MTRLASHCLKLAAFLALALSLGTAVWAQGKIAKSARPTPPHRAHWAAAAKTAAKPTRKAPLAAAHRLHRAAVAGAVVEPTVKADAAPAPAAASPESTAAPAESDTALDLVGKRDPFVALVNGSKGPAEHLPPGKAGLVIGTLTVQGAVQGANGMIAVVANPDQRVYFVREGDRLYDGDVEKISLDGVTFQQNTKDAFGKPIERTVVKRIYPSAGEQQ